LGKTVLACGLLACFAGWVAIIFDALGPTGTLAGCDSNDVCSSHATSLWGDGITGSELSIFVAAATLWLGVAIGARLIRVRQWAAGATTLAGCLAVLLVLTLLSAASVGLTFLPADLIGLVCLGVAIRSRKASSGLDHDHVAEPRPPV
jgi:hypothetical protein